MDNSIAKLIEEIQRQAEVCETVAKDKNQESLTGEASDKEKNEAESKEWLVKAGVWREVEIIARRLADPAAEVKQVAANPLETRANVSVP